MAYGIPPETIERVRSQADIVEVISEYLTLKRAGGNYKACCPFHKEKTASFMVSPSKQIYHCFGCGAGGNVFGFLMQHEGLTFAESVKHLASRLGIQIKEIQSAPGEQQIREQLESLYDFTSRYFHKNLLQSADAKHAREYLEGRSISQDTIKLFSIGYAPTGWESLISAASKKGFSKELLLQGGLAKKSPEGHIYDAFRNRIMFPIHDTWGKVIAFGGRTLEEGQPKYINSPETTIYKKGQTLYNLHRAKKSISNKNSVIVVEGYTDLTRLVMNGIENVVASLGTAFTQSQARLLKRHASEVVLVFDSDSAGEAAASRGIEVLLAEDLGIKVAVLSSCKDPDEFVLKEGADAFHKVIAKAGNFVEFHLENSLSGQNGGDLENKIRIANRLASLLGKVPDPIRKAEYLRLVAGRLGLNPETLLQASQKGNTADIIEEEVKDYEKQLMHEEKKCMWMLKLLMQRPEEIRKVRENLDVAAIKSDALRELFAAVFETEGACIEEDKLFAKAQSVGAQRILSKLTFEKAGPELLYPVEWWVGFMKCHQKKQNMVSLLKDIAEAERAGKKELNYQLAMELRRALEALQPRLGEMAEIPVFIEPQHASESLASLLKEIGLREIAKAEQSGDAKCVSNWNKSLRGLTKGKMKESMVSGQEMADE